MEAKQIVCASCQHQDICQYAKMLETVAGYLENALEILKETPLRFAVKCDKFLQQPKRY